MRPIIEGEDQVRGEFKCHDELLSNHLMKKVFIEHVRTKGVCYLFYDEGGLYEWIVVKVEDLPVEMFLSMTPDKLYERLRELRVK